LATPSGITNGLLPLRVATTDPAGPTIRVAFIDLLVPGLPGTVFRIA